MTLTHRQPARRRWIEAATAEAIAAGLDPVRVLAGDLREPFVAARHRAFRRIAADGSYSIVGIARVAGFHHATVLSALGRLKKKGARA